MATIPFSNRAELNDLLSVMASDCAKNEGPLGATESDPYAIDPTTANVLVVDDEPINVEVVSAYLADEGYANIISYTDSVAALAALEQQTFDVALFDIMMPRISGLDLLRQMRASKRLRYIPTIVLTASTDRASKRRAIELGAADFLNKPFDPEELIARTKNALFRKAHFDQVWNHTLDLEQRVERRTAELVASQDRIAHCLRRVAEYRDPRTGQHALRVGRFTGAIARHMDLPQPWVRKAELAATLHDIGKVGIPDSILRKQDGLTDDEIATLHQHAILGHRMMTFQDSWQRESLCLSDRGARHRPDSESLLDLAATIALTHHERWDGTGYPSGLVGEAIPLAGRIVAVADEFDHALSSRKSEPSSNFKNSVATIQQGRNSKFDPSVIDAFVQTLPEISSISTQFRDEVNSR